MPSADEAFALAARGAHHQAIRQLLSCGTEMARDLDAGGDAALEQAQALVSLAQRCATLEFAYDGVVRRLLALAAGLHAESAIVVCPPAAAPKGEGGHVGIFLERVSGSPQSETIQFMTEFL